MNQDFSCSNITSAMNSDQVALDKPSASESQFLTCNMWIIVPTPLQGYCKDNIKIIHEKQFAHSESSVPKC